MKSILDRLRSAVARHFVVVLFVAVACLAASPAVHAVTVFNGANGGMAFGVAPWVGAPNPGTPLYINNTLNGRNDLLTNPGIGQSAASTIFNNTFQVPAVGPSVAWGPGQFIFGSHCCSTNVHGPFGSGAAIITGPQFGFRLADGGTAGGVSTSFQHLIWEASFTQVGNNILAGNVGNFIAMSGRLPQDQDLVMMSLRTQLQGLDNVAGGNVEMPGLVLLAENLNGPGNLVGLAIQDENAVQIPGVVPMGGGWAIILNQAAGTFRALAWNTLPDLGALDGVAIQNGDTFTARMAATIYADPASVEMLDPFALENADLLLLAAQNAGADYMPLLGDPIIGQTTSYVPEPSTATIALFATAALWRRRRQ